MFYYTYVLYCKNSDDKGEFYIGSCEDLTARYKRHKTKEVKTTSKFKSVTLVYYEASLSKTDARKRELQLKTGFGRGYIKRRLENYFDMRR